MDDLIPEASGPEAIREQLEKLSNAPILKGQISEKLENLIGSFFSETVDKSLARELLELIRPIKNGVEQQRDDFNKKHNIVIEDQLTKAKLLISSRLITKEDEKITAAKFIGDAILGQYTTLINNIDILEQQKNVLNEGYKIEELLRNSKSPATDIGLPLLNQYDNLTAEIEYLGGISGLECMTGGDL